MKKNNNPKGIEGLFGEIKTSFLDYDPAFFIQNNLTLDGASFSILNNGWKFMADVYRYVALQATQPDGKPVVICKGRQVGATMMAAALDLYFTNSGLFTNPPIRVAHLFPTLKLLQRFSQDKFESLIRTAKDDRINNNKLDSINAVDNMTMKQFETGTVWIESIGADGDRIRGMTLDATFFDECQDMNGLAIGNATKTLTAAKYGSVGKGVQVYFGTPKEKDSYFNKIWEASDKRYYHLGCSNCKETFPFYQSGSDSWKEIWLRGYIIKCPLCGFEQHKVDAINLGKWVSSRLGEECKYVGFHISQLYVPNLTREHINDQDPTFNPDALERTWSNEVIGEFFSGAGLPLSRTDIYDNAADLDREFSRRIRPESKNTYLGVDWGGKADMEGSQGQSYSCVVILSSTPDGTLLIEHCHKLKENSPSYKKDTILEMYKRFGVKNGVSDWFFGQDVVYDLQMIFKDKFLGAQGSGNLAHPVKYREDDLIIGYNKDLVIEELFDKIRKGRIRFPWKSYENIDWLIDHCTSMESSIRMVGGQQVKTFKKGNSPNDGLMALMYAYLAYKFDVTKGFKIRPGIDVSYSIPKARLSFAPKLRA